MCLSDKERPAHVIIVSAELIFVMPWSSPQSWWCPRPKA